jgi:hypothetical protein
MNGAARPGRRAAEELAPAEIGVVPGLRGARLRTKQAKCDGRANHCRAARRNCAKRPFAPPLARAKVHGNSFKERRKTPGGTSVCLV